MTDTRSIEYLPLDALEPSEKNPKLHSISQLQASVDRFGFVAPAIRDERTGRLVVGHGRISVLKQAKQEGFPPPSGIQVKDGDWLVPVVVGWASRDDEEAAAYLIADNRLSETGGWDEDLLASMLAEIDLTGIGYSTDDLEDLLFASELPPVMDGNSPDERADAFEAAGIRTVVLPFQAGRYEQALKWLEQLRKITGEGTNSDAVYALLEKTCVS